MAGSARRRDGRRTTKRTVGDLCEAWFSLAEPDLSPSVAPQYRVLLDNRILSRWGDTPLRRLETADLDRWYSELRRSGRLDGLGGLSANSVKRIHSVLRRALDQGVRWGWLRHNPAADATVPRAHRQALTLPDPAEVQRLIAASERINPSLPVFLRLAAVTGARRGELCALRWQDVDFDRGRLTIARSIVERAGELIEKDTKTPPGPATEPRPGDARRARPPSRPVRAGHRRPRFRADQQHLPVLARPRPLQALAPELRHARLLPAPRRAGPRRRQTPSPPPLQRDPAPRPRGRRPNGQRSTRPRQRVHHVGHLRPVPRPFRRESSRCARSPPTSGDDPHERGGSAPADPLGTEEPG